MWERVLVERKILLGRRLVKVKLAACSGRRAWRRSAATGKQRDEAAGVALLQLIAFELEQAPFRDVVRQM